MSHELAWLLVAIPAVSAAILLLGGKATNAWGHLLGTAASLASFVCGALLFFQMQGHDAEERSETVKLFEWFSVGSVRVDVTLLVDQLSILFVLLITGVGSLIHIYSIGYMSHDPRRRRFFAYLNLFIAAMLLLVLAADYLLVFVGWEGVGLASYLLIGFWQDRHSAATAAKKAFVVNRVGDIGLSLAVMSMWALFGSSAFATVNAGAEGLSSTWATLLGLMLLLAACGKSAQVPLQSWLLDAMEGPTPVSALIHAATMVTAGVYLVTRSSAIYEHTEVASTAVVIVGTVTVLAGAIIGCAKDDIKKALAGSTMSQIGYMMLAAGLGPAGYVFAIFHLITHGFFKANMFLGAGSVMHGMNDDVNMRHYGALRLSMKVTFVTFAMGYLAIIGFPGFAGFWSKDKIIEAAFAENFVIGLCALLAAGITAFYMTRLMMMTFFGKKRWAEDVHPHESPSSMTVPLIVLAVLSVFGGALYFLGGHWIVHWLEPVVGHEEHHPPVSALVMTLITVAVVAVGAAIGFLRYRHEIPREAPVKVSPVTTFARRDLYGDALNEAVLMRPGQYLTRTLVWLDNRGVDGLVNGLAALFGGLSGRLRRFQTGFVRSYALSMVFGAAFVVVALLAVRLS
ncbi:proton-translocating NADH-quinone oxidoreductase, chain L [Kribbella flavida DSM 17836]|uniref:Proton-translocating NADH-quinone oxidoreductase, chain L n=1 Tax=Kribbella flavida (strain DSM 17836 / JCM 10339 / NBRC 14399) TaxID=479435 RepID=D2PVQ0_KRIFD|nr:NADH-quinone oxidoreductase subunit L [Kribbella flavida]ADB35290.1 proton-translocating NADH-quinone oxidoreductase, chain L [Kribbella flavida DSM 17836]